ncbi:hypothetical protein LMG19145_00350 [Xanthomonas arboricola pv. fragariae]|nr:hypothetical protein LMG19145_00350 [Xanthomonas arboricola pv. fragariae]
MACSLTICGRGLTTHSSRSCFATRLNSGVRPWWSKCVGGCRFGEFAGVHAVGSGQQSSPLLVGVSSVLRLARRSRAALVAVGFGGITRRCIAGQAPSRKLWHTRSRRQCWGAWLHHPTFAATHCLTTHSSRSCFATRLNSRVRQWWSKCVGGCCFGEFAGVHAVGSGQQSSALLVAVSSVLRPRTSLPRCAHCICLREQPAPGRRWASSIPQAVAHSVKAAVLGSRVAPSNLRDHSLPNNSFKPKLLRNSA